jgi:hypothetical protein
LQFLKSIRKSSQFILIVFKQHSLMVRFEPGTGRDKERLLLWQKNEMKKIDTGMDQKKRKIKKYLQSCDQKNKSKKRSQHCDRKNK